MPLMPISFKASLTSSSLKGFIIASIFFIGYTSGIEFPQELTYGSTACKATLALPTVFCLNTVFSNIHAVFSYRKRDGFQGQGGPERLKNEHPEWALHIIYSDVSTVYNGTDMTKGSFTKAALWIAMPLVLVLALTNPVTAEEQALRT